MNPRKDFEVIKEFISSDYWGFKVRDEIERLDAFLTAYCDEREAELEIAYERDCNEREGRHYENLE